MNIALWIVQIILAAGLIFGGFLKFFQWKEKLNQMFPWTAFHPVLVTVTGLIDLLIGLGMILPQAAFDNTLWIGISAAGLVLLMIAASIFHIRRGEAKEIIPNVIFGLLALFVLWERLA